MYLLINSIGTLASYCSRAALMEEFECSRLEIIQHFSCSSIEMSGHL